MSSLENAPTYNLKAVVQETGLKPDTLRAWERRYGLPEPRRTASGHRIYSQRDIDILKWLIERQDEGLSISRAVALWRRLLDEGTDPVDSAERPGETMEPSHGLTAVPVSLPTGGRAPELRKAWVAACLSFDEQQAEKVLSEAFSLFAPETVCIEILQHGLADIGEGWEAGRITAQQEHFASSLAMQRLQALLSNTPPPIRPERVIVGCAPGEEHVFSAMLLSLMLRRKGWHVIYLGASIPMHNLENTIASARPTLVILTAQQMHTAATLQHMAEVLYNAKIPMAYGGRIFNQVPDICNYIAGHFLGSGFDTAIQNFEQIILSPRIQPAKQHITIAQEYALARFQEQRGAIETAVWHEMRHQGMDDAAIESANAHIGSTIVAALQLCQTSYLSEDAAWLHSLLVNHHGVSPEMVQQYTDTYMNALCQHAPEYGPFITDHVQGKTHAAPMGNRHIGNRSVVNEER